MAILTHYGVARTLWLCLLGLCLLWLYLLWQREAAVAKRAYCGHAYFIAPAQRRCRGRGGYTGGQWHAATPCLV